MQTLKSFLDQSLLIWKDSTAAARFGLVLLMVICVGAVIGVGYWSAQPQYVPFASDLTPDETAKLIDAFEAADFKYQPKGSGTIYVDKHNWSRAQVAAGKLGIRSSNATLEELTPWMDPKNQDSIMLRNLQRELEQTIEKFPAVISARVHLGKPEKQAFIRHRDLPTAAIVLEISKYGSFNDGTAASIAQTVANTVPGLTVDRVSVADTNGNVYTINESLGRLNKQEEYRITREYEFSQKAETILARTLGYGNATVAVTTDFTFPNDTRKSYEVDPEQKVITSEKSVNSSGTGQNSTAVGASGTASNINNGSGSSNGKTIITKSEELDSTFDFSKSEITETKNTPIMSMMTVSVIINSTSVEDENKAIPADVKTRLEALVRQAVGFRDDKDQISIEFFPFVDTVPAETPSAMLSLPWDKINQLLKNLSLGLAAVVALFIAIKALRKIQPDPAAAAEISDRAMQVNTLSDLVKQNPEIFSKIIESWSSLDSVDRESETQNKKAA